MIVTSFGSKGYEDYGRRFIEGFIEHWPDEALTVYHEGALPDDAPRALLVAYVDLAAIPEFLTFHEVLLKSDPLFQGLMLTEKGNTYNFRYDVNKFCRKVFAIHHYEQGRDNFDPFAWIDADVTFTRRLPEGFLREQLGRDNYIAHLGRAGLYTETGFVVWDPTHEKHAEFMKHYWSMYASGAFRLLSEWHDCYVFDFVSELLEVPRRNLAKGCDPTHPWVFSVLGLYMEHHKGPERKAEAA